MTETKKTEGEHKGKAEAVPKPKEKHKAAPKEKKPATDEIAKPSTKEVAKPKKAKEKKAETKKRLAVVRVRGKAKVRGNIEDTMKLMNLTRVNHCTVIDNKAQYMGMIKKVNNHVTWGEIDEKMVEKLLSKRGRLQGNEKITDDYVKKNTESKSLKEFSSRFMKFESELKDIPKLKPVFRLSPPSKGYERKGIKKPVSVGGALGYRGEKINELLEKMV